MVCTLLGTGTSQGVPVIGCDCGVCTSANPHDNRLRQSALITSGDTHVLIDAGPDFRQQMLRLGIKHLDAILLTHEHNDHVIGIDDIRPFNHRSGHPMRVYALPRVAEDLRRRFAYVFGEPIPGLPRIELIEIHEDTAPWQIGSVRIEPIGVQHGQLPILGFRFGELTYLTDVKTLSDVEMKKVLTSKYLIVNALQHKWHPTHMCLSESLELVSKIKPVHAWLIHISHTLGCAADVSPTLPEGVSLGYDGLQVHFNVL
jgi:phosphoribosyl 1,2-cyclic phosphate phosphodiesterase